LFRLDKGMKLESHTLRENHRWRVQYIRTKCSGNYLDPREIKWRKIRNEEHQIFNFTKCCTNNWWKLWNRSLIFFAV